MKIIINILFWGLFSLILFLAGLYYAWYADIKSETVYWIAVSILVVCTIGLMRETKAWIRKLEQ